MIDAGGFKRSLFAAILLASLHSGGAFAEDPNPVPKVPKGDPAMNAAFARAAAGLDGFFAKLRNPPKGAERFSVKIGLTDASGAPGYAIVRPGAGAAGPVEWFWTNHLNADGAGFTGQIANDAEDIHNVAMGQTIHFTRADIGDWMYFQDDKIVGNATACPALAHASAEGAAADEGAVRARLPVASTPPPAAGPAACARGRAASRAPA
jgi:uncharacterized protein YegJ (DUF2314 family)